MISPPSPSTAAVPSARALAEWWNPLAAYAPSAIVAGRLPIHRLEVQVEESITRPIDPLTRAVFRAVELGGSAGFNRLTELLGLGDQRLFSLVLDLQRNGWLELTDENDAFRLSDPGRLVFQQGIAEVHRHRRPFAFRDQHYLPLPPSEEASEAPLQSGNASHRFEHEQRRARLDCLQTLFPELVLRFDPENDPEAWRSLPVEWDEAVEFVGVAIPWEDRTRILGYIARGPDWKLPPEPTFTLDDQGIQGPFPELFAKYSSDELHLAWRDWAKSRNVPGEDLAACEPVLDGHRLRVRAPARLRDWLRGHRPDAFDQTAWLWIGSGVLRRGAVIVMEDR